ncbi:hypothetical protein D3C87_1401850 [compost metagenome]
MAGGASARSMRNWATVRAHSASRRSYTSTQAIHRHRPARSLSSAGGSSRTRLTSWRSSPRTNNSLAQPSTSSTAASASPACMAWRTASWCRASAANQCHAATWTRRRSGAGQVSKRARSTSRSSGWMRHHAAGSSAPAVRVMNSPSPASRPSSAAQRAAPSGSPSSAAPSGALNRDGTAQHTIRRNSSGARRSSTSCSR